MVLMFSLNSSSIQHDIRFCKLWSHFEDVFPSSTLSSKYGQFWVQITKMATAVTPNTNRSLKRHTIKQRVTSRWVYPERRTRDDGLDHLQLKLEKQFSRVHTSAKAWQPPYFKLKHNHWQRLSVNREVYRPPNPPNTPFLLFYVVTIYVNDIKLPFKNIQASLSRGELKMLSYKCVLSGKQAKLLNTHTNNVKIFHFLIYSHE